MVVTVEIEKTVYGGDGLGRLGDGRVVFVPGAFAGETVRAELTEQKKRYVKARLVEVVTPIAERKEPDANAVPGMVYSTLTPAGELKAKTDQLENFLWKVAHSIVPLDVVDAPDYYNYRNKVVYHTELAQGKWVMGYRAEPEHRVVDITTDPLACKAINAELPNIRRGVMVLLTQGPRNVRREMRLADNVTIRWTAVDGVKWFLGEPPPGLELHETVLGKRYRVSGDGFFQVNPAVGEKLVSAVCAAYEENKSVAPEVLDLYCGVGVFGLAIAPERLIGVESGRAAIACARRNAEVHNLKANFFCERVGASLSRIHIKNRNVVIVDPPRGGMEPNVAPWLAASRAPRIFYVSCDPATLTRDLATICRSYKIHRVTLFNMFPRTARFETLVELHHV